MVRGAVSDLMILSALHMVMVPLSEPPMTSPLGWAPWIPYALHTNLWNLITCGDKGEYGRATQVTCITDWSNTFHILTWHYINGHFVCTYCTVLIKLL